jgi:predicted lipoprotein with Yx(FWY)xxD motif
MSPLSQANRRRIGGTARIAAIAAAAAVLLAACGASNGGGGYGAGSGGSSAPAGTSAVVTIETHSGPLGTYLTDRNGMTLYLFGSDTSSKSTCSGTCAMYWPPVLSSGTPQVSGDASTGKLATITRADGTQQVTYGGHPLYHFKLDTAAGDTKGEGLNDFGAHWYVVDSMGQQIAKAAAAHGGY